MTPNQDARKKLTSEDVRAIRDLWNRGVTRKFLAGIYGVSPEHIGLIVKGYRREAVANV